jgi:hypothetical protein
MSGAIRGAAVISPAYVWVTAIIDPAYRFARAGCDATKLLG